MTQGLWMVFISVFFSYLQMAKLANRTISGHLLENCQILKKPFNGDLVLHE